MPVKLSQTKYSRRTVKNSISAITHFGNFTILEQLHVDVLDLPSSLLVEFDKASDTFKFGRLKSAITEEAIY